MNEPLPESEHENPETQPAPGTGPHDISINVLGTSFSITAGEAPEYLDEVLAQYQVAIANTQNISGMKDPLKVAILTGFLLCDEINKLKLQIKEEQANVDAQQTGDEHELHQITENLISSLDLIMERTRSFDG